MPRAYEIPTSRNLNDDGSTDLTFGVEGTIDDAEALGLAFAAAPTSHLGKPRSPLPTGRNVNRGIFEFTFKYALGQETDQQENEPQGDLPTIGKLDIKPIGGTQHITQCLYQVGYSNLPAGPGGASATAEVEIARVIGLHKDGVHGCDIDLPGSIITLDKKFLPQAITGDYILALERLKGKTNLAPYTMRWALQGLAYAMEFEPGELRFGGAGLTISQTPKGLTCWDVSYSWIHHNNRRNVKFGSSDTYVPGGGEPPAIVVAYIGGHDYPWAYYGKKELTGPFKATIEAPKAVFVSTVCESENYLQVLGF